MNPIRVFCACAPDGLDAESQLVVEHSLVSRASRPVEITWMRLSRDPDSPFYSDRGRGWDTRNWATPFSWFRYAIPELCSFEGRAIYCDSDVMFLADVAELADAPMEPGKVVMARSFDRLCVSLWDCAEARTYLPPIATLQRSGPIIRNWSEQRVWQPFPKGQNWNCLDGDGLALDDPSIRAIHFTDIATQPQMPLALARLAGEGRRHWFEGRQEPHPRPDLVVLFNHELEAGYRAGLTLDRYDQEPRYGKIEKRDLSRYRGGPRLAAGAAGA
jgi:hypothetical protein